MLMDKGKNTQAAELATQKIDPAATSSETLSDIEANETANDGVALRSCVG
ncbi:MAG: hypothetical protein WKF84_07760 [Pyrinomonadaceae bacterium]